MLSTGVRNRLWEELQAKKCLQLIRSRFSYILGYVEYCKYNAFIENTRNNVKNNQRNNVVFVMCFISLQLI